MKKILSSAALAIVLLLAVGAFAAEKTVTFSVPTSVNGQTLAPGDYQVKYQVNGSTADLHFLQNKKEVATVSGEVVERATAAHDDSIVTKSNGDGTSKLLELQFANKKSSIKLASESSSGN
jgi:hypothetical protein